MLKGWRTVIFNVVTIAVTLAGIGLQYIGSLGLTEQQVAIASIVMTLITTFGNIYLRSITTTPMGKDL